MIRRVGPVALLFAASVASAQAPAALSGADSVLRSERYVAPAPSIADAVLAPRYRSVVLTEINSDRTWFIRSMQRHIEQSFQHRRFAQLLALRQRAQPLLRVR